MDIINILVGNEYICDGGYKVSESEMKEMISDSGFSSNELRNLYNSKYPQAMKLLEDVTWDFTDLTEEDFGLKNDETIRKIHHGSVGVFIALTMFISQIIIVVLALVGYLTNFLSGGFLRGVIVVILLSWAIELLLWIIGCGQYESSLTAVPTIIGIEDYYADKMADLLAEREKVLNSVANTHLMYSCIKEMII